MKKNNKKLTTRAGSPVVDNQNVVTAGPRGPQLTGISGNMMMIIIPNPVCYSGL